MSRSIVCQLAGAVLGVVVCFAEVSSEGQLVPNPFSFFGWIALGLAFGWCFNVILECIFDWSPAVAPAKPQCPECNDTGLIRFIGQDRNDPDLDCPWCTPQQEAA